MENINNTIIPEIPIQPITPEPTPTPSNSNLFKYLFIISIVVLLISIISFILILNNKNTKQSPVEQNTNNISEEITPTKVVNEVTPTITIVPSTKMTSDQIFQEASSQLGIVRSQFIYFRIFGQDKIQYSTGPGTTYAYKINEKWFIARKDAQDIAVCDDLQNVPEQYRPQCLDSLTNSNKYTTTNGASVNYPLSQMVSYIGQ